ncbi:RidA family protein [Plantactinospora sp. GCM10030261]|uniref:RidA family protein n=1 Tax=Plantactinospora sp. GCM10030261 TaxID=3273420 RepID=UPI0036095373
MSVTLDNPAAVAAPFGDRFSHVARVDLGGDAALLVLSGQVGCDDSGAIVEPGDITAQSERIFKLIEGILAAHGATFADVVNIRTFMTDLAGDLAGYAAVRRRYFTGPPPTSTTVEVNKLFLPDAVIEVEITAVTGRPVG